jgi:hypothetical protein
LSAKNVNENGATKEGERDDIYKFLEESWNEHLSLLAHGPTIEPNTTMEPNGKSTLFNETWIGHFSSQEDLPIMDGNDTEMLRIVDDHCRGLKIDDSKEMKVGIAYGVPFELEQFGLFHVSMHIDATADSNKEGRPLVTVTSNEADGHMFFVICEFLPSERSWTYKWLFQIVFLVLLEKDVLNKLSIVVTDGDSQEITQLKDAVNNLFPNVYRIQCSWHKIDRGGFENVNVPLGGHSRRKWPPHLRGKPSVSHPPHRRN